MLMQFACDWCSYKDQPNYYARLRDAGYHGYFGQEFLPQTDVLTGLAQARALFTRYASGRSAK